MPEVGCVELEMIGEWGRNAAVLEIHTLPQTPGKLWDERGNPGADQSLESVQLSEGREYRYIFRLRDGVPTPVTTDRQEVFVPDDAEGCSGRLRPGLFTGALPVSVFAGGKTLGSARLEVRAYKLDYLRDYRWMLRDIADIASELAMDRFAASEMRFRPNPKGDAETLYQQFAFLRETLLDERFLAAIQNVLSQPYVSWREEDRVIRPGQGWSGGSSAVRQLAKRGPRLYAAGLGGKLGELGVPARLITRRAEPATDNVPNQFVKFALTRWLDLVRNIEERLGGSESAPVQRGRRETRLVREHLEGLLADGLFREVGPLTHFPGDNQVLQKREGYRDVLRLYAVVETAAQIAWSGGDEVYAAGQKNVASLYEYWAFIQLAQAVAFVCGRSFSWANLVAVGDGGLTLDLRRGKTSHLGGTVARMGRRLGIDLYFNRTFGRHDGNDASWTRAMRPDCSLRLRILEDSLHLGAVWLHFDAKYRVQSFKDVLDNSPNTSAEGESAQTLDASKRQQSKRDDLLKMHAYRDAIRQSVGAYTLYPGTEDDVISEYFELLPGLGAFALRPSETGTTPGRVTLQGFISEVVDHLCSQATQHERGRFWEQRVREDGRHHIRRPAAAFLTSPPIDTNVVLGYVRSEAHWHWIRSNRIYNIRADHRSGSVGLESKALSAQLAVLYSSDSGRIEIWTVKDSPSIMTKETLLHHGYPFPGGELYFCLSLGECVGTEQEGYVDMDRIVALRGRTATTAFGAPISTTWGRLIEV
jgi:predicted component of viral defense system (DUF524 family)